MLPFRRSRSRSDGSPEPLTLGPLRDLPGGWVGRGFNLLARPPGPGEQGPLCLTLNATRETMTFAAVTVPVFAGGAAPEDAQLPGVYFLARANDAGSGAMVHAESGTWLNIPGMVQAPTPASVLRLAKSLDGEDVLVQGTHRTIDGPPAIGPVSVLPIELSTGQPVSARRYLEPYTNVSPPPGIAPAAVMDPTVLLRDELSAACIARTTVLSVTTEAELSGLVPEIANTAFAVENPPGLSAEVTLWLARLAEGHDSGGSALRLQFCSRRMRNADGYAWPEVWVASLQRR